MKRKGLIVGLVFCLLILSLPSCKKGKWVAGKTSAKDMLSLFPQGPAVLLSFNMHQFSSLSLFDKMTKEWNQKDVPQKVFRDYADFVAQTGIDLKKDAFFAIGAVYGDLSNNNPDFLGVLNLRYDQQKILAILQKNSLIKAQEDYQGTALYTVKKPDMPVAVPVKSEEAQFAFLNPWNIAIGSPSRIKAAIDLSKGKGQTAKSSAVLRKYLDKIDSESLFWLVLLIPDKAKSAASASGPMPVDLSKAEAFLGFVDYRNKNISGDFRLLSANAQGNKQIADMLNGFKAMGAMNVKEPEFQELLNNIQFASSAEEIKLTFQLSEALLEKLGEKAKEKAKSLITPTQPVTEPAKAEETPASEGKEAI